MAKKKVSEPVQVYLDPTDRRRLERLTEQLGATKSGVLRRGLSALERELTDPAAHPALRLIGIAPGGGADESDLGYDPGREHDRFLSESEEETWRETKKRRGGRRGT